MDIGLTVFYLLSLIITAGGAIWLLRDELGKDRRRIEHGHAPEVTWANVVGGTIVVFMPILNFIIAIFIVVSLLDRPVLSNKRNS